MTVVASLRSADNRNLWDHQAGPGQQPTQEEHRPADSPLRLQAGSDRWDHQSTTRLRGRWERRTGGRGWNRGCLDQRCLDQGGSDHKWREGKPCWKCFNFLFAVEGKGEMSETSGSPLLQNYPACSSSSSSSSSSSADLVWLRLWCEMLPCLDGEDCELLLNHSGWSCRQPGGRVRTTRVSWGMLLLNIFLEKRWRQKAAIEFNSIQLYSKSVSHTALWLVTDAADVFQVSLTAAGKT